ncbi:MAG: arsenate reductase [Paracoccaceae bacterium]
MAPALDLIFTVCEPAAAETSPYWLGHPMTAHWGILDPTSATWVLIEDEAAFDRLSRRIDAFLILDLTSLAGVDLEAALIKIGKETA